MTVRSFDVTDRPVGMLSTFQQRMGRPLRVLHVGNIANNAYNNARIQRQHGIEADVLCHDYYHTMASPEWEDGNFVGEAGDSDFPDWWAVDLKGFRRPRWFAQGPLDPSIRYLLAYRTKSLHAHWLWHLLEAERWLLCRRSAFSVRVRKWIHARTRGRDPLSLENCHRGSR